MGKLVLVVRRHNKFHGGSNLQLRSMSLLVEAEPSGAPSAHMRAGYCSTWHLQRPNKRIRTLNHLNSSLTVRLIAGAAANENEHFVFTYGDEINIKRISYLVGKSAFERERNLCTHPSSFFPSVVPDAQEVSLPQIVRLVSQNATDRRFTTYTKTCVGG